MEKENEEKKNEMVVSIEELYLEEEPAHADLCRDCSPSHAG